MTTSLIESATDKGSITPPGEGERALLLLLAAAQQGAEDVRRRPQEDAAIDAEDILTQAEEALVMG